MSDVTTFMNDSDILERMASGDTAYKVDSYKFSTPTIEDFLVNDLSESVLEDFRKTYKSTGHNGPAFYVEAPYKTEPGFYQDANVLIVRAQPVIPGYGKNDEEIADAEREYNTNAFDGDTLHFFIDSIEDDGKPIIVGESTYSGLKDYIRANSPVVQMNKGKFGLRFVGVNAPEIPHYSIIPADESQTLWVQYGQVKNDTYKYVLDKSIIRNDNDQIKVVKLKNKYHEIVRNADAQPNDNSNAAYYYTDKKLQTNIKQAIEDLNSLGLMESARAEREREILATKFFRIVTTDESEGYDNAKKGLKARDTLVKLLGQAEDMVLMIDCKTLNRKSGNYPNGMTQYDDDYFLNAWGIIKYPWDQICDLWKSLFGEVGYRYLGFNMYGQDAYKRFLGALYVKIQVGSIKQWVNVAKYLMSEIDDAYEVIPDYTSNPTKNVNAGFVADAFKIWSYNSTGAKIVEFISKSELDDRRQVQRQLGYIFDDLKDWTVMIGDCLFMVPPTSIRCVTQTESERIPLLRSRNSMIKAAPKSERLIEMTLYFNDDEGINGKPFKTELPNGQEITYYMNGLRTLIAMFKLTPFLPIENHYINKVLNIEAVSLVNLQISTMPGYPRCIAAILTLQEFNYHVYMPEIPIPDRTDEDAYNTNLFAGTICFETMRWHYQRPILRGEEIKDLDFNDPEYIDATFGQRTALQPMKFKDSNIDFYVIDKEYLDQMLQLKLEAMRSPIKTQNRITDDMREWAKRISHVYESLNRLKSSAEYVNLMNDFKGISTDDILALKMKSSIPSSLSSFITQVASGVLMAIGITTAGKALESAKVPDKNSRYKLDVVPRDYPDNRINMTSFVKLNKQTGDITVKQEDVIYQYLDKIYDLFWKSLNNSYVDKLIMSEDIDLNAETDEFTVTWNIKIGVFSEIISKTSKENFLKIIAGELYQDNGEIKNFFDKEEDAIKLQLTAKFKYSDDYKNAVLTSSSAFEIDESSPGYKFLQLCYYNYGKGEADDTNYFSDVTSTTMMEKLTKEKQALDYEDVTTFKFVKYPIGNVVVTNVSCVFGNTLTRMSLKALDGYAPQYCGGQDTIVEITMQTTDEEAVSQINLLPRMAAQYVRDYRLILNCWPLRINSEITRLFGVNEVLIEDVDITTVAGQPGLFNINIRLISVDRTTRNKEALKKLEVDYNSGSKTNTTVGTVETKSYFDLKEVLAKAEVYPDLELPTISELEYNGFKYIKYINREGFRIYPDPDFYFVYSHVLGSEIIRDTILKFTEQESIDKLEFQLSDAFAASVKIVPQIKNAYSIVDSSENEQALAILEQKEKIQKMVNDAIRLERARQEAKEPHGIHNDNIVNIYNSLDAYQTWDIAENIRCMFRENKFLNAIDENEKWYQDKIEAKVEEAVRIIDEYLNTPIEQLASNNIINWNSKSYIQDVSNEGKQSNILQDAIDKQFRSLFGADSNTNLYRLLQIIEADLPETSGYDTVVGKNLVMNFRDILLAAADAASSDAEYDGKDKNNWKAKLYINVEGLAGALLKKIDAELIDQNAYETNNAYLTPYCKIRISEQGDTGIRFATSLDEAVRYGYAFGPFQIRLFKREEIEAIENSPTSINTKLDYLFLDPYYRKLQIEGNTEEINKYKRCILMDPNVMAVAFIRNFLFYLRQLLKDGILLSLYEIVQDEAIQAVEKNFKVFSSSGFEYYTVSEEIAERNKKEYEELKKAQKEAEKKLKESMTEEERKAYEKQKKEIDDAIEKYNEALEKTVIGIANSLKENKGPLWTGKVFAVTALAITHGNKNLYNLMKERNYDVLNQLVRGSQLPNSSSEFYVINKFVLALVGRGVIRTIESIGTKGEMATEMIGRLVNEKIYLEAADDPAQYIRDSFIDMIVNDKRGRMARAFPTYYMMFIDEGREIGYWKLHDNFYNISSIAELQITRSRKIAADTARIVMTNMFNSYTTDDEDSKDMGTDTDALKNYQYTWRDVYNSIFSPRTYFLQEELKRREQLSVERTQLKPGIRVHLRMGYSSDASELPIVFNGMITEVGTGEAIELICQGYGVELTNPILSTTDAEDIQHSDQFIIARMLSNWITKGATPRTILGSILTSKGGWLKKTINNLTNGRFFNDNPFGIVHFGDPEYTDIFQGGECVQNIYEASHTATFGTESLKDELVSEYATEDVPKLSAHVFGKSYWDLMHICAGASPDFIAAVVPFGLRSSIFYGLPRYYYAYDYERQNIGVAKIKAIEAKIKQKEQMKKNITARWERELIDEQIKELREKMRRYATETQTIVVEKRKPFQQYHIYTSFSDIIGNNIKASSRDVRTCAVGLYQKQGAFGKEHMDRVGPMWVDYNIYPEKQKTMTVDTQFLAKGVPVIGDVLPFANTILNDIGVTNGYEIAWRITAKALKDSIKDMYQGELIVIGDPTVKPYDRIWIEDMYEQMQGACEVEAVVHNFDVQNGFTTSIFVDCISAIDDRHEQITHYFANEIVGRATAAYVTTAVLSYIFASRSRPFLTAISAMLAKGGSMAKDAANSLLGFLGKEEILNNEKIVAKTDEIKKWLGLNKPTYKYDNYMRTLDNYKKIIGNIDISDLKNLSDYVDEFDELAKALKAIDPEDLIKSLDSAKEGITSASKLGEIEDAINALKNIQQNTFRKALADNSIKFSDEFIESLRIISSRAANAGNTSTSFLNAIDDLNDIIAKGVLNNADDIQKNVK